MLWYAKVVWYYNRQLENEIFFTCGERYCEAMELVSKEFGDDNIVKVTLYPFDRGSLDVKDIHELLAEARAN